MSIDLNSMTSKMVVLSEIDAKVCSEGLLPLEETILSKELIDGFEFCQSAETSKATAQGRIGELLAALFKEILSENGSTHQSIAERLIALLEQCVEKTKNEDSTPEELATAAKLVEEASKANAATPQLGLAQKLLPLLVKFRLSCASSSKFSVFLTAILSDEAARKRLLTIETVSMLYNVVDERQRLLVVQLAVKNALKALEALREGKLTRFDAGVGDFGCQRRAVAVYNFCTSPALMKEAERFAQPLEKASKAILKTLQTFAPFAYQAKPFRSYFKELKVSPEMDYLFKAHLLTCTKQYIGTREETNISALDKMSKGIDSEVRSLIVNSLQSSFSADSVRYVYSRAMAMNATAVSDTDLKLMQSMLAPECVRKFTAPPKKEEGPRRKQKPQKSYPSKSFSCCFFEYQAILCDLRQSQCIAIVKEQDKKEGKTLFFQTKKPGAQFSLLPPDEVEKIPELQPCVVMEGAVPDDVSCEALAKRMTEIGLYELMLMQGALSNQFEKGSDLSVITNKEAVDLIKLYREKAAAQRAVFALDHVYAVTKREVMKPQNKRGPNGSKQAT